VARDGDPGALEQCRKALTDERGILGDDDTQLAQMCIIVPAYALL
jgi:hypothetical protein